MNYSTQILIRFFYQKIAENLIEIDGPEDLENGKVKVNEKN